MAIDLTVNVVSVGDRGSIATTTIGGIQFRSRGMQRDEVEAVRQVFAELALADGDGPIAFALALEGKTVNNFDRPELDAADTE
jgi:hypothetical protein